MPGRPPGRAIEVKPRVVAAVLARMGSTRLPGKILTEFGGRPALEYLVRRLRLCPGIDEVVVATSEHPNNDIVERFCLDRGFACFRGPEDDVAARLIGAMDAYNAQVGICAQGDGPLIDPQVVLRLLTAYGNESAWDFVGNSLTTTYPPGMEAEVFSVDAFRQALDECNDPAIREHATLCLRRRPDRFRILNVDAPPAHRRPELEIELDTEEDRVVIDAIVTHFAPRWDFGLDEIIAFLDANTNVARLNADVPRRWKAFRNDPTG